MRLPVTALLLLGLSSSVLAADLPTGNTGDSVVKELKSRIDKSLAEFNKAMGKIRTGRASTDILAGIMVPSYDGTRTPLNSLASLTTPEARLIVVKPNEKTMLKDIEKALREANLGLVPMNTGEVIRLEIPAISQERKKDMIKQIRQKGEESKVAIKKLGRDANERLGQLLKDGKITADENKRASEQAQKEIDTGMGKVEQALSKKEKEVLEN